MRDPAVLVGAGTRRDCPASIRRGIIEGHAYSVLHAVEAVDRHGETHRLLLLRNPWAHGEWHGPNPNPNPSPSPSPHPNPSPGAPLLARLAVRAGRTVGAVYSTLSP